MDTTSVIISFISHFFLPHPPPDWKFLKGCDWLYFLMSYTEHIAWNRKGTLKNAYWMNKWFFSEHMQFDREHMAYECQCPTGLCMQHTDCYVSFHDKVSISYYFIYRSFLQLKMSLKIAIILVRMIQAGPHFQRQHMGWFWWQPVAHCLFALSPWGPLICVLSHPLPCHPRNG